MHRKTVRQDQIEGSSRQSGGPRYRDRGPTASGRSPGSERHFPRGCPVSGQANAGPGHGRVQTPGEGFSSNSTPDVTDNTGLLWASPPSVGFNSNKGLLAIGASLSGQIMLSDFPACLA